MTGSKIKQFSFPLRNLIFEKREKGQKMVINLVIKFQEIKLLIMFYAGTGLVSS